MLRVLFQRLQTDDVQVPRDPRIETRRSLGLNLAHAVERLRQRIAGVRCAAGEEGVEDRAETVDVNRRRACFGTPRGLLRRHVGRRSREGPRIVQVAVGFDPAGETKVGDVRRALFVDQDVGRLEVSVENPALMRMVDRLGRGDDQAGRGARVACEVVEPPVQALTRHELHTEVGQTAALADFVDRYDVRMVQPRDRLGLVAEPPLLRLRGEFGRLDHLDRNLAAERRLSARKTIPMPPRPSSPSTS